MRALGPCDRFVQTTMGLFTAAILLSGCGGGDGNNETPTTVTLTEIQDAIFTPRCVSGCHTQGGIGFEQTNPNLDLSSKDAAFAGLVNVKTTATGCGPDFDSFVPCGLMRVEPFNPDNSYLIWKVDVNNQDIAFGSDHMPRGCTATDDCLTQAEIDMIRAWITNGAQND